MLFMGIMAVYSTNYTKHIRIHSADKRQFFPTVKQLVHTCETETNNEVYSTK
jgi:hypothetical protein